MRSRLHARRNAVTMLVTVAILGGFAALALMVEVTAAQAETRHFTDPAGDMTSGQQIHPGDIEAVTVRHETRLRVTVRHEDLQPHAHMGATLFIDTKTDRPGPELVLFAGLSAGTDYIIKRAHKWEPAGDPLTCFHRVGLDYVKEKSTFVVGRACLGDVDEVRVALRVSGPSRKAVDWLRARRAFTPGVSR